MNSMRSTRSFPRSRSNRTAGFTLAELLIAVAMFTVFAGAAFSLMAQHLPLFNQQQGMAQLNISMRNAVAQMQVDVVNGGAGYYSGVNIPNWPVGVVINNNVVTSSQDCHTGTTYGANCFDSFTVIVSDPNTTPVNPLAGASGSLPVTAGTCTSNTTVTSSMTSLYVLPPTGVTAATYARNFNSGDQILLVKGDGSKYTTTKLTANGGTSIVSGVTYVLLTHGLTVVGGTNTTTDDQTGMSVNSSDLTTDTFCATDWVLRLTPIKYDVDTTTDPTNPTLRRTVLVQGQTPTANGVPLTNQLIGFKVGASLITGTTDTTAYNFNSSTFGTGYDYTLIRSVMVSLVGRTVPNPGPSFVFRNSFDGGPYQIQGVSVVINPRNMSMAD